MLFMYFLCHSFESGIKSMGVFHQGIAKCCGITFGQASIICSFVIIIIVSQMGLKIGWGTIYNLIFIGLLVDVFDMLQLIPDAETLNQGIMMMCLSMLFNALGSYFYISCEIGCGPRDGLMSVLTQKSGLPVGIVRSGIEFVVFLVGWRLGGQVGLGTLLNIFGIGLFINLVFKIMQFDIAKIKHQTIEIGSRFAKG